MVNDKLAKVRAEIERRKKMNILNENKYEEDIDLLSFYNSMQEDPKDKCKGCNNVKGCITCVDGSEYAHIEECEDIIDKCIFDDDPENVDLGDMPFGARNSELEEAIYYIPEGYHAILDGDKVIIKKL